jgi:4-amino-4-deoxy-L-arabinose transferase-like glycosyltransferase
MDRLIKYLENNRNYFFVLLLITIYLILDFQNILLLHPQGIHFIRQTDSLSFASNYFKHGFNFFHPQVFNLQSTDGRAACEFPILYYITSLLYLIFNEHDFILRIITLSITSAGFLYLFKLLFKLLQDLVYAIAFSLLFISSTVLLYYTNNFLPDASALGFTLIGWYYFFAFIKNRNSQISILICFIFFSLASLLKVTYFLNPVAAILSLLVYNSSNEIKMKNAFRNNVMPLVIFTLSFMVVLSWNVYVYYYNKINHDNYFLIQSRPIWSLSKNQVVEIFDYISNYWYSKYYYQSTFHVFFAIIVAGILFIRKSERIILILSLILAMGSICYLLLFFSQFKDHDYYFIALIPAIIFLVINAFIAITNKYPGLINNYIARLLISALCILSLNYAREKLIQRFNNSPDLYSSIGYKLAGARNYLDSLGISENAKFIIITDQTPNGGLYTINRPGWNLRDTSEASLTTLRNYILQGADYILITDKKYTIIGYLGIKIGEYKGIQIYKLKNGT